MPSLVLKTLEWNNCGSYLGGPHVIDLDNPGQLIYVSGSNKVSPDLGSNDIGKSTILNILYWCLTGKTLRSSRPGTAIEPWSGDVASSAILEFLRDDVAHVVCRMRNPNSLSIDDSTATQEQVFAMLGLSEEAIKHTIIAGQFNELFISLRPEQQSSLFAELLGLDLWLKAVEVCSKKVRQEELSIKSIEDGLLKLEGNLSEIEDRLVTTKIAVDEFEATKAADLIKLKASLAPLNKEYYILEGAFNKAEAELKGLPDISEQEKQLKGYRHQERTWFDGISTIDVIKGKHERELISVEEQLTRYREADNICPACGQPVDTDHIEEKVSGFEVRRRKLVETIEASEQTRHNRKRDLLRVQDEIKTLEEALQGTREHFTKCNQHYNASLLQVNEKKSELDHVGFNIQKMVVSTNPYVPIVTDLNGRKATIRTELIAGRQKLDRANLVLGNLKIWSDGFKQIRLDLIDETLEELEVTANKHAARLGLEDWEIGFHTERETKKGDVQHKFTINIFPPGLDSPVPFETLGGGVSTRLQLAVFFGLSEVLLARAGVTPNIEFLDEPTRMMSSEGVDDLLEALKERAADLGRTIYFIDHHQLDTGYFDKVLWIEKDEHGSRIISQ